MVAYARAFPGQTLCSGVSVYQRNKTNFDYSVSNYVQLLPFQTEIDSNTAMLGAGKLCGSVAYAVYGNTGEAGV